MIKFSLLLATALLSMNAFAQAVNCSVPEAKSFYGVETVSVVTVAMPHHPEISQSDVIVNGKLMGSFEYGIWNSIELLRSPAKDSPASFNEEIIVKLEKQNGQNILRAIHTCNFSMNEEKCSADYDIGQSALDCK